MVVQLMALVLQKTAQGTHTTLVRMGCQEAVAAYLLEAQLELVLAAEPVLGRTG